MSRPKISSVSTRQFCPPSHRERLIWGEDIIEESFAKNNRQRRLNRNYITPKSLGLDPLRLRQMLSGGLQPDLWYTL
jgi:hypothetical protein